jgi:hypothetical protein
VKCSVEIIVSTVSGRPFPAFFASHGPVVALAVLDSLGLLSEAELRFACTYVFVAVAVGLFTFCVRVTSEISAHLGIQVFKINPKAT